jgi:type I restriction enzyme S subunit
MTSAYGRAYFTANSKQSTNLASTNSSRIRQFPIPLPKLREQNKILQFIEGGTKQIDALIGQIELAIQRLVEFRSALISASVTGQIDVREELHDSGSL